MFSSDLIYYRSKWIFLFMCYTINVTIQLTNALVAIPNNVRLETEVIFNDKSTSDLFTVEEFADRLGGSVQVKVVPKGSNVDDVNRYYRIKDFASSYKSKSQPESVITYSLTEKLCREERTSSWSLKELSSLVKTLSTISDLDSSEIQKDRTAIGPLALLKLIYANSHMISLETEVYDEMRFSDVYLFQTKFMLNESQMIRILISYSKTNVKGRETLVTARTLLSETITTSIPNTITVAIYNKDYERYKPDYSDLYKLVDGESKKITVSFFLMQEISFSKQLGVKPGKDGEQNPFTLPVASGCSTISKHNVFYVSAKQFSGVYLAMGSANKHFIAYDSLTKNFRLDIFGEYKMVYDMKERFVTYMMPSSLSHIFETEKDSKPDVNDRARCAQTYLMKEEEDGFFESQILEDILGFDHYCGLMYLGDKLLDDGTQCLVFERQIDERQLPLIVRNNLLKKVKKGQKLFLVYYFVDELTLLDDGDGLFTAQTYKSMWLKRIELISVDIKSNLKIRSSSITFTEFSWSLESMSEDTSDPNSRLLHPVRTFDTIECKSTHSQHNLELIIKKSKDRTNVDTQTEARSVSAVSVDSFEEGIMTFLTSQLRLSRTLINELQLISSQSQDDDNQQSFLVKAKLVDPLNFIHTRELIGWIKSVDSFPFDMYGRFLRTERSMSRHECSLLLATYLSKRKKVYMTYCPNVGCAYLDDISLEYTKKTSTEVVDYSDSFDMCEIYEQKKVVNYNIVAQKLSEKKLHKNLNGSEIVLNLEGKSLSDPENIEEGLFRGTVVRTHTTKGLTHESLGLLIKSGVCYTKETRDELEDSIRITDLHLELHHSQVHCHKACHLSPDCQTYSYNRSSHLCILTNIQMSLIGQDLMNSSVHQLNSNLPELDEDSSCNLYAINPVRLYSKDSSVLVTTPAGYNTLSDRRFYYTINDLTECAKICHLNELTASNKIYCQKFDYFPLLSVCVIEDKDLFLYKTRQEAEPQEKGFNDGDSNKTYTEIMTREEWFSSHHCFRYKRDYAQHYSVEEWTSIRQVDESDETGTTSSTISLGSDPEQKSDVGSVLYDLDEEDCLRECTLVNNECLAVNYCQQSIKGRYTRYCFMFTIRSPVLIHKGSRKLAPDEGKDKTLKSTLNKIEAKYFIEGNSNVSFQPIEDRTCLHYYLEGDNLALKKLLMEENEKDGHRDEAVLEVAINDLLHSNRYMNLTKYYVNNNIELLAMLLVMIVGSTIGLLISIFGIETTLLEVSNLAIRKTQDNWSRLVHRKADRSQSTVEFNVELGDMRAD